MLNAFQLLYCAIARAQIAFVPMADDISPTTIPVAAAPSPIAPDFFANPVKLLQAVSDPARWAALRALAAGPPKSVLELSDVAQRSPDLMSKHLKTLREAGAVIIVASPDGDGRKQHCAVPERFRRLDETGKPMIDYGVCALRFP
jgi:DNA-binding transcriptional ArsR family regulator